MSNMRTSKTSRDRYAAAAMWLCGLPKHNMVSTRGLNEDWGNPQKHCCFCCAITTKQCASKACCHLLPHTAGPLLRLPHAMLDNKPNLPCIAIQSLAASTPNACYGKLPAPQLVVHFGGDAAREHGNQGRVMSLSNLTCSHHSRGPAALGSRLLAGTIPQWWWWYYE